MKIYAIANYVRQYGGHGEDSTEEAMIRVVHPLFESREEAEEYLASLGRSALAFVTELETKGPGSPGPYFFRPPSSPRCAP